MEVYDLGATSESLFANISTRGFVQTGDNVMIGGFIVVTQPTRVIIRAIGPSLTQFGVPDALANPQLELHDATSLIGQNDDWQTTQIGGIITSDQVAEIQNSQLAPTNPAESAIIATLQPGSYTAIVRGVNNTTGNALVEVYALPEELINSGRLRSRPIYSRVMARSGRSRNAPRDDGIKPRSCGPFQSLLQETRRVRIPRSQFDRAAELENLQRLRYPAIATRPSGRSSNSSMTSALDALADNEIGSQVFGQLLKFPSHVYRISDHGEFHSLRRPNVADNHFAMIDRDTDSQLR